MPRGVYLKTTLFSEVPTFSINLSCIRFLTRVAHDLPSVQEGCMMSPGPRDEFPGCFLLLAHLVPIVC